MPNPISGLKLTIQEMANRIRELRIIEGMSPHEVAEKIGVSTAEYLACESGEQDLNFAFLYRCALTFGVDITDIIQGTSPTLSTYSLTRKGEGERTSTAHGMTYYNLAFSYKNRIAEPLYVLAEYSAEAQRSEIPLTTHVGQELDIVISGQLKVQVGTHTEILSEGDTIYYDSSTPHGMIAVGGQDCAFYAIPMNPAEYIKNSASQGEAVITDRPEEDTSGRVWQKFISIEEGEDGSLRSIRYHNTEQFNFAYDVVDAIAEKEPNKLAFLHLSEDGEERRFTFSNVKKESGRAANYFRSLGISRGDRVMLILRRHYQFWFIINALHKLGAVVILAPDQLLEKDLSYRFEAAGVSAIVCTGFGHVCEQVEAAAEGYGKLKHRIMVNGTREGWRNFDTEYIAYSSHFPRTEATPCGEDPMLMFFTSGTSGYPKIALHSYTYPLGHFAGARYWHQVRTDGLHLTIADTGWAKAMWGKLYGQWLCEAGVFVYDFDRFHAEKILPLFAKYRITTFCAPPTMLRMMIREDITRFDLSTVRHMSTAGEALNPEVYRRFREATGVSIMEGFGQSETTVLIANSLGMKPKLGSMGKPMASYGVDIYDPDGNPCAVGVSGEICISVAEGHPCGLVKEYYGNEEQTRQAFRQGLYHTGDIAYKDEDGYYWYVSRIDDVIKSSGYRIGPFEIENVLMELPYVLECGVSAAPDEVRGQVVKASIVLTSGTQPSEELKKEIQEYVKSRTAPYKYPRIIIFRESLPKTTSGKVQRSLL